MPFIEFSVVVAVGDLPLELLEIDIVILVEYSSIGSSLDTDVDTPFRLPSSTLNISLSHNSRDSSRRFDVDVSIPFGKMLTPFVRLILGVAGNAVVSRVVLFEVLVATVIGFRVPSAFMLIWLFCFKNIEDILENSESLSQLSQERRN